MSNTANVYVVNSKSHFSIKCQTGGPEDMRNIQIDRFKCVLLPSHLLKDPILLLVEVGFGRSRTSY